MLFRSVSNPAKKNNIAVATNPSSSSSGVKNELSDDLSSSSMKMSMMSFLRAPDSLQGEDYMKLIKL